MKKQTGITLIALVVTIIVLIILAGVSINLVLGENGIITKAKEAKQETINAQIYEQEQMNETVGYLENLNTLKPGQSGYEGGNYDDPYIPVGFTHIGTEDWNSGYIIREKLTGNEFVWVPCVLSQSKVKSGDIVQTYKKILPSSTDITDSYNMYNKSNLTIIGEEGNSASEIEASVGKYGGFYIARYEAGIDGKTENYALEEKTLTSVKPLSQAGKGVWNYIIREDAITVSKNMIDTKLTGAKSALISGAAWDTTLMWMVNSSANATKEPNLGYDIDSTGRGWYGQVTRAITGQYSVNNIYDMAGNVWEWTTENCEDYEGSSLVDRGGGFAASGLDLPASSRYVGYVTDCNIGFRVVLYK